MKTKIEKIAVKKGFVVSEEGLMYNSKGNQVALYKNSDGYFNVNIRTKEKSTNMLTVHRLQAYQKYGDAIYEGDVQVRHLNGNKEDNSWDNINIGSQSENQMDIPKQIRVKRALVATSYVRKYDKDEVKGFYKQTKSYKKTMKEFNISSKGTLHYILNN